ncbi:MAG: GxxExxY protein [Verrucomicrobiota bacterium]
MLSDKHLTEKIISFAIAVHCQLGSGFLESIYEEALAIEKQSGLNTCCFQVRTLTIKRVGREDANREILLS